MISERDQKDWDQRMSDLAAGRLAGEPSWYDLTLACDAIARSPYTYITDAMLRLNGGFLPISRYNAVLSVLIQDEVLIPRQFNCFVIDRRKVPKT